MSWQWSVLPDRQRDTFLPVSRWRHLVVAVRNIGEALLPALALDYGFQRSAGDADLEPACVDRAEDHPADVLQMVVQAPLARVENHRQRLDLAHKRQADRDDGREIAIGERHRAVGDDHALGDEAVVVNRDRRPFEVRQPCHDVARRIVDLSDGAIEMCCRRDVVAMRQRQTFMEPAHDAVDRPLDHCIEAVVAALGDGSDSQDFACGLQHRPAPHLLLCFPSEAEEDAIVPDGEDRGVGLLDVGPVDDDMAEEEVRAEDRDVVALVAIDLVPEAERPDRGALVGWVEDDVVERDRV